jgi:hypothetical protein
MLTFTFNEKQHLAYTTMSADKITKATRDAAFLVFVKEPIHFHDGMVYPDPTRTVRNKTKEITPGSMAPGSVVFATQSIKNPVFLFETKQHYCTPPTEILLHEEDVYFFDMDMYREIVGTLCAQPPKRLMAFEDVLFILARDIQEERIRERRLQSHTNRNG